MNTLDGNTTGAVNAHNVTTITGTAADANTAYASGGIAGLDSETVTISDTTLAATVLNTLDGNTTGAVNASTVTTLTGAASAVITAYDSSGISGLGNEKLTLSGNTSVANANTLAADTTGVITATITETAASTLATLTETTNAYTITVGDTSVTAANLNTIDGATTVAVTATAVTTITGAASAVNTAYASSGINGLGNEAITLDDTTLAVATLNTLDGNTTGAVNAATITTLTGAAAAMNTAYASSGITGLANEAITLDDTSLAVSYTHHQLPTNREE